MTPTAIHPHDVYWVTEQLSALPLSTAGSVSRIYSQTFSDQGRQAANLYLLQVGGLTGGKSLLHHTDKTLQLKAERLARIGKGISLEKAQAVVASEGLPLPTAFDDAGVLARMACPLWWERKLRRKQDREQEQLSVELGLVRKGKQAYVSSAMFQRIQARHQASLEVLANYEMVSDDGDTLPMLDVLKGSVANPEVRRAELMVRMRGFEDYAKAEGHTALFYTLTTPSKFHRYSGAGLNPKYQHSTPRQAQAYLCQVWARIRSQLKRDGINVYGFRVAEPHHDGTPHWHILLFMRPEQASRVTHVMRDYALQEDGNEPGASEYRFKVVVVDGSKGSATGYIAKYISKNIDGFGMDVDHDAGISAADGAARVRAWSSVWGIRQFQQIGGASVGAWRELRRLLHEVDTLLEDARQAADKGDWAAYLVAQGGATLPRKKQPIHTFTAPRLDNETGSNAFNRYGETVRRVHGVCHSGDCKDVVTRTKQWTIQPRQQQAEAEVVARKPALPLPVATTSAFDFLQAEQPVVFPWSPVNNCTQGDPEAKTETPDRPTIPLFYSDDDRAAWLEWRNWYADHGMDEPGSRHDRQERAAIVLESMEGQA